MYIKNLAGSHASIRLHASGHAPRLPEYINDFFVSVSAHLPKVDSAILKTLTDDYCVDYVVDPADVNPTRQYKHIQGSWTRRHT